VVTRSESLVLFDIDGTLVRGAGLHHKHSLIEGIRRVTGLSTTLDDVPTAGMLDRDLIVSMLRIAGHSKSETRKMLPQIMAECQSCYAASCAMDLRSSVCVGVPEFLANLEARGAVLGLVTGNLSQIGWKKVELAGLRTYFSIGAFAEDGTTRTRLARLAARLATKQGLIGKNCRISLIGDHGNDVEAARRNGFRAVAVATGVTSLEELRASQPDILVSDLTELDPGKLI
jgi:phosphoglycolate phosphatase-like HAD superfamily hydrolase